MDVAEHVADRRAVDADAGGLLQRDDRLDRDAIAGLDDLQGVRLQASQQTDGNDGGTARWLYAASVRAASAGCAHLTA
jgi:hypothetical protein